MALKAYRASDVIYALPARIHLSLARIWGDRFPATPSPNEWVTRDASDETQLLQATTQGRCILPFNVRDFVVLAKRYPRHGGIILAVQASWTLSDLLASLDRLLSEREAEDWIGQVHWLND